MLSGQFYPYKALLRERVGLHRLDVSLKALVAALLCLDLGGEVFQKLVLQPEVLALVVGPEDFQLRHIHIKVHLLTDQRIAGAQGLDLRIGERLLIHIVTASDGRFARHDLRDEFLFVFQRLIEVGVKGPLGHILENLHLFVSVALPDDAPVALGHVGGAPAHIQVVDRHKTVLHIGPGAHLLGGAEQDAHLPGPHLAEQLLLLRLGVGVMDKGDLLTGDASRYQFVPDVLIDIERAVPLGRGEVAEQ